MKVSATLEDPQLPKIGGFAPLIWQRRVCHWGQFFPPAPHISHSPVHNVPKGPSMMTVLTQRPHVVPQYFTQMFQLLVRSLNMETKKSPTLFHPIYAVPAYGS